MKREKDGQWAEMKVELKDGRLSITGSSGRVLTQAEAEAEALACWESYFEEQETRDEMALRVRRFFETAEEAARYVVSVDGVLHGLDVHAEEDGKVYILDSCGCIGEELLEWFPEARDHAKFHLNDMKAGCEHQEELGWGHGRDVALDAATMTPAQQEALQQRNLGVATKLRLARYTELKGDLGVLTRLLGRRPTVFEQETFEGRSDLRGSEERRRLDKLFRDYIDKEIPVESPRSEVFKDSIGAPCPTCGYRYGERWLRRELPIATVEWAQNFGTEPANK
jgi:hypothetical protein